MLSTPYTLNDRKMSISQKGVVASAKLLAGCTLGRHFRALWRFRPSRAICHFSLVIGHLSFSRGWRTAVERRKIAGAFQPQKERYARLAPKKHSHCGSGAGPGGDGQGTGKRARCGGVGHPPGGEHHA